MPVVGIAEAITCKIFQKQPGTAEYFSNFFFSFLRVGRGRGLTSDLIWGVTSDFNWGEGVG